MEKFWHITDVLEGGQDHVKLASRGIQTFRISPETLLVLLISVCY